MSEGLSDFIESVTGDSHLRVEDDLGDGFVRLRSAEAERRQAKHDIRSVEDALIELLRNARDAHARLIFVASQREGDLRRLTMLDNGDGIPAHLHELVFEARVTSKLDTVHFDTWGIHGRGMALYGIRMNAKRSGIAASVVGGGTSLFVEADIRELGERRDQSTAPAFVTTDRGTVAVRGPRNILRTVAEFAYAEREVCQVYLGSPTEIAATLWAYGQATVSPTQRAFAEELDELPPAKRLACAADPDHFARIAEGIGLALSARSARRIMDGQIGPLDPYLESIPYPGRPEPEPRARKAPAHEPTTRERIARVTGRAGRMPVDEQDLERFARRIGAAFQELAEANYLSTSAEPRVRIGRGELLVRIPLIPDEGGR